MANIIKIRFLKEFYRLKEVSIPITLSENPEKNLIKLVEMANEGYQREQKLQNKEDEGIKTMNDKF